MQYLLDTNIVSYILRGKVNPHLVNCLTQLQPEQVFISGITYAELLYGAEKIGRPQNLIERIEDFLETVNVLGWGEKCAVMYAHLRNQLRLQGISVDTMDMLIGCHAQAYGLILVTNDHI